MREIKFQYIYFNNAYGGKPTFESVVKTLEKIERQLDAGKGKPGLDLIARHEWTGLKDKNDADVYEGDIVASAAGTGVVKCSTALPSSLRGPTTAITRQSMYG